MVGASDAQPAVKNIRRRAEHILPLKESIIYRCLFHQIWLSICGSWNPGSTLRIMRRLDRSGLRSNYREGPRVTFHRTHHAMWCKALHGM